RSGRLRRRDLVHQQAALRPRPLAPAAAAQPGGDGAAAALSSARHADDHPAYETERLDRLLTRFTRPSPAEPRAEQCFNHVTQLTSEIDLRHESIGARGD